MQIVGLPEETQNMSTLKNSRLQSIDGGVELEPGEDFYRVEIFAEQPISINYANGKTFHVQLMPGVRNMPMEFLANNPDILNAMRNYRTMINTLKEEGTEITNEVKAHFAKYAAFMVQGHQRINGVHGNTIQVRLNDDESNHLDSDPIPGATLNSSYLRTERVNVDTNGIITSIVLDVSPEFGFDSKLEYDFSLLATTPELVAA